MSDENEKKKVMPSSLNELKAATPDSTSNALPVTSDPALMLLDLRTIRMFESAAKYALADPVIRIRIIFGGDLEQAKLVLSRALGKNSTAAAAIDSATKRIKIQGRDAIYEIDYNGMQDPKNSLLLVDWAIIEQFSGPILRMYQAFNGPTRI